MLEKPWQTVIIRPALEHEANDPSQQLFSNPAR